MEHLSAGCFIFCSNLCPLKSAACLLEELNSTGGPQADPVYWKYVGAFAFQKLVFDLGEKGNFCISKQVE